MPFYELVCIARAQLEHNNLKDLLKVSAAHVLQRGGVVRGFDNWGERELPTRMKRHQQYFTRGNYWIMHFDSNPLIVHELGRKLLVDPRVIRHTFIKLGDRLDTIVDRPDKETRTSQPNVRN